MPLTRKSNALIIETRRHAPGKFYLPQTSPKNIDPIIKLRDMLLQGMKKLPTTTKTRVPTPTIHPEIPLEIKKTIVNYSCIKYSFALNGRTIYVYFASRYIDKHPTDQYIQQIQWWIYVIHQLARHRCASSLTVYIYLTNMVKTRSQSQIDNCIDRIHANTAFTTPCQKNSTIVIFREEEWFKVFIHETFHAVGLDFSGVTPLSLQTSQCLPPRHFSTDIKLYEAYTECWATICHTLICAIMLQTDKNDVAEFRSKFEFYLSVEREFSLRQLSLVLDIWGITLYSIQHASGESPAAICEKTAAFSYYVIKCALLNEWPQFVQWCSKSTHILQFSSTPEEFACYSLDCIAKLCPSQLFVIPKRWTTMRMTCVEADFSTIVEK